MGVMTGRAIGRRIKKNRGAEKKTKSDDASGSETFDSRNITVFQQETMALDLAGLHDSKADQISHMYQTIPIFLPPENVRKVLHQLEERAETRTEREREDTHAYTHACRRKALDRLFARFDHGGEGRIDAFALHCELAHLGYHVPIEQCEIMVREAGEGPAHLAPHSQARETLRRLRRYGRQRNDLH